MFQTCSYALSLSAAALWLLAGSVTARELRLTTESYPPYNYEENGVLKGVAVDLMKAVMQDAGIKYEMSLMPWARAYGMALHTQDHCVFSTVHTAERDQLFAWVGPLYTTQSFLVKQAGSSVNPKTIEEATPYLVGTQLGDYTVDVLKQKHFDRIDLTSTIDLSLKKLLAGRIDLMPMGDQMIIELRAQGLPIEPTVLFQTTVDSLACNKKTDPNLIRSMQASLNKLIADGTREAIFRKYNFFEAPLKP